MKRSNQQFQQQRVDPSDRAWALGGSLAAIFGGLALVITGSAPWLAGLGVRSFRYLHSEAALQSVPGIGIELGLALVVAGILGLRFRVWPRGEESPREGREGRLAAALAAGAEAGMASTVIVTVVDEGWAPLPGAKVTLRLQRSERGAKLAATATSNGDGDAIFALETSGEYSVEAECTGFKAKPLKGVRLFRGEQGARAYLQIRMKVAGPLITFE